MAARTMRLTGDRNRCPTCAEYFNSSSSFDLHRTGRFGVDRRCRTVTQMAAAGMTKNAAGFWVEKAHSTASVQRLARFSGAGVPTPYPDDERAPYAEASS